MANFANAEFTRVQAPIPNDASIAADKRDVATPTAALALNDTQELAVLPAGCVPVGYTIAVPDLDTNGAPTISISLGLLNAGKTDLSTASEDGGAFWSTGLTTARTGGVVTVDSAAPFAVRPVQYERYFAYKVTAAAATWQPGTWRVSLLYRPA